MPKNLVHLPDIDLFRGIAARGMVVEIQYSCAQPGPLPRPEDIHPDTLYSVQLSVQQAEKLVSHLSQALAMLKRGGP